jgi:hypothetical protein
MAFQSGSFLTADGLVPIISTFMQGQGWSLIDQLASDDLVFKSQGSNGKFPMIIRVSSTTAATNSSRKAPYDPTKVIPQVFFRGYHLWLSGTMSAPSTLSASFNTGGGTLLSGFNYWRVTAVGASGETTTSPEVSVSGTLSGTVDLTWAYVSGAIGYNVYGRLSGTEQKIISVWGSNQLTWRDPGPGNYPATGAFPTTNTAHGGHNEYGSNGYTYAEGNSAGGGSYTSTQLMHVEYRIDSPQGPQMYALADPTVWFQTYNSAQYWWHQRYNGSRLFFAPVGSTENYRVWDMVTGDTFNGTNNFDAQAVYEHSQEWVYNQSQDKFYIYTLTVATPSTNFYQVFQQYDFELDTWARLANVPWTTVTANAGGFVLWDGADTLYIMPATSNTAFYKYSIAGNTYTQLTSFPQQRPAGYYQWGNGFSVAAQVYVPASVSGFTSDVIYCLLDNSANLYCYNVNTNTWNAAATPNLTLPANPGGSWLVKDPQGYMYYRAENNANLYRMHNANTSVGWGTAWPAFENSAVNGTNPIILNHPVSAVRTHPLFQSTYWIFGSVDGITVATNTGNLGRYYWSYFGRTVTRRRNQIMTLQSSITSGTLQTATVDSSTLYNPGDVVYLYDPTTANQEQAKIGTVPSSTQVTLTLLSGYASGSLIGVDPFQTLLTGDSGQACAPADPGGFKHDRMNARYWVVPVGWSPGNVYAQVASPENLGYYAGSQMFNLTAPDGMGYYQPSEPFIFSADSNYAQLASSNPDGAIPARSGYYGTISNVYFLKNTTNGPQAGALVSIGGKNYIYFPQTQLAKMPNWNYGVLLGTTT